MRRINKKAKAKEENKDAMLRVEKHVIDAEHESYQEVDDLCNKARKLFNAANFYVRQTFIATSALKEDGKIPSSIYLNYNAIDSMFKKIKQPDYYALPSKVSQQILMQLNEDWTSFFESIKDWKINPGKYKNKPGLPRYKKSNGSTDGGRAGLSYTMQAVSKKVWKKEKLIGLSGTTLKILSKNGTLENIKSIRIACGKLEHTIEVVYEVKLTEKEKEELAKKKAENKLRIGGGDPGLNNLLAITSNTNAQPILINGRPVKSINQYYNKKVAEWKSELMKEYPKRGWSKRLQRLTNKRYYKIMDYLHNASRKAINHAVETNMGFLVVGKNPEWKQEINIGGVNNQNFVCVPHAVFIDMLIYKGVKAGITVLVHEESYTSKCSFLDEEEVKKHETYAGRRIKRGLFKSKNGILINADCNGSGNIVKKEFPNAFADGIEGVVVRPLKVTPVVYRQNSNHKAKKQKVEPQHLSLVA